MSIQASLQMEEQDLLCSPVSLLVGVTLVIFVEGSVLQISFISVFSFESTSSIFK